tara:strand:+ start:633 stop:857 length:225 start_codon:yes stop_codon:yes gene_type:complete
MSDYCSICSPFDDGYDIDLAKVALELDNGHSSNVLCEVCNIKAVYKDEKGNIYLAKEVKNEIELESTTIEKLMP